MSYDCYACIGGEGWYWERCSANFLVNVIRNMFSETPPVAAPFREDYPITLGDIQGFQITDIKRKEYYENIKNFVLRSSAGTIRFQNDSKFEAANFQELSFLVHISSSFEELFIRRNAVLLFIQRILRSAQTNGASLKPAYPGSSTYCTCGKLPHCEYCPLHDIFDDEKEFLFPSLHEGDRVIRGPDWQWGIQGDNQEGTVLHMKDWKGVPNQGIRIHWDNGDENMYRYGAEKCYDVVEAFPMKREEYQPLQGLNDAAETYWSRYVCHYVRGGLSKSKGLFAPHISRDELVKMLPDYDGDGHRDVIVEQEALNVINQVIEVAEKDILDYLSHQKQMDSCFKPSSRSQTAINAILFPYQIYLLSQAEGDAAGQRCETAILQAYLSSLFSSCIRIMTKATTFIFDTGRVSDVISALRDTSVGLLVPFLLSALYVFDIAIDVISFISGDLQEITYMWCKLLKLCNIENDPHQKKDNLLFLPVFDLNYKSVPQPIAWYMSLFYMLTSITSKIHFGTRFFQIADKTQELQHIAESFLFSGGLRSMEEEVHRSFLWNVFDNTENSYGLLHEWLDTHFPEPAWKRKHDPIVVDLELRLLAVFAYYKGCGDELERCFNQLKEGGEHMLQVEVSETIAQVWRDVLGLREFLRSKRQEFTSHQNISVTRAQSVNTVPLLRRTVTDLRSESLRAQKMKEYSLRIRTSVVTESSGGSGRTSIINKGMRRLMSFMQEGQEECQEEWTDAEFVTNPETYDDFIDVFAKKLHLLMSMKLPLDLNGNRFLYRFDAGMTEDQKSDVFLQDVQRMQQSLTRSSATLIDDRGLIPTSQKDLVAISLRKFLTIFLPVSIRDVRRTLNARSENARTLSRTFDDAVVFLKTVEDFPQACRLFLLGLSSSLTSWRSGDRRDIGAKVVEDGFRRDYLHHTEGCDAESMDLMMDSLTRFTLYLKELFQKCVINVNWRLGCAIVFFLATLNSPKLLYLPHKLQLPLLFRSSLVILNKWYARMVDQTGEVLISPGPFWDALATKVIPLSSSHFHVMLEEFQNKGCYLSVDNTQIQGIFPISIFMLANVLRLAYSVLITQQFEDHRTRSRHSPAQNKESLYFWTLADVSNLFVRQSAEYILCSQGFFREFMGFIKQEQDAFRMLCDGWQPFAHSLYSQVNTSMNPNTCVRVIVDKSNLHGSLEGDMRISAAESVITSYLGLIAFLMKTRLATVLPLRLYGDLFWDMLTFSPRIQKLTLQILQFVVPKSSYMPAQLAAVSIPVVQPDERSVTLDNPLLVPPELEIPSNSVSPYLSPLPDAELSEAPLSEAPSDAISPVSMVSVEDNNPLPLEDATTEDVRRSYFVYYLLHLASHADSCVGALVGERAACAMCCQMYVLCFNLMSRLSPCAQLSQKGQLAQEILETDRKLFLTPCRMHIHPDGHGASYCSQVFAEEVVYLIRSMMETSKWRATILNVFQDVLDFACAAMQQEKEAGQWPSSGGSGSLSPLSPLSPHGDHLSYDQRILGRTVWYTMTIAVLKVLGSLCPRVYAGCRIRVQEYIMNGKNEVTALMRAAFQSSGTGYVIEFDRTMAEAVVLMDKIETPQRLSIYAFDVVDRVPPPQDIDSRFKSYAMCIQQLLLRSTLAKGLLSMPLPSMPFFNTNPLSLSVHELQDALLQLNLVRALHHMVVSNELLGSVVTQPVMAYMMRLAVRPIPCNMTINTLIVRQYFNWFQEYLINTYSGSPRFLPMELQSEDEEGEMERRRRGSLQFGMGKEEMGNVGEDDGKPRVLRDGKRMKKAKIIAGITGYAEEICYKVFRAFQDNMDSTINYLMESKKEFIMSLADERHSVEPVGEALCDDSILTDLETGIRRPLLTSQPAVRELTPALLSTAIPPFTRLQKVNDVNTEDTARSTSLYGVISSVSDEEILYSPVNPTGVITDISGGRVRLSSLNIGSGIVEDVHYPEETVAVQKYRLLFHLDDVQHLRGILGRICCVLNVKYIREMITCLLYVIQSHNQDVIDTWKLNPYDIVRLTKFTYLAYNTSLVLTPATHNNMTLQACLFRILRASIKKIVMTSRHDLTMIQAFMDGTWDSTDKNKVTLYVPPEEVQHSQHVDSRHMVSVSSISLGRGQTSSVYISSLHPSFPKSKYADKITIPGAAGLRVLFDSRCTLDSEHAALTFFQDEKMTEVIARFSGAAEAFCPFTVRGNTLRFQYESEMVQSDQWGYGFLVQPFENLNWSNDGDVLTSVCFDWNCFAFDLLIDISKIYNFEGDDFFNRTTVNLIEYLRTSGMPFKSRVVELLIRLMSSHNIHVTARPDVSGMYKAVIRYCASIDRNTIVPSQLPLLLEFLCTYMLQDAIAEVRIPDDPSQPVPLFDSTVVTPSEDLSDSLTCVHILARSIYHLSLVPQQYLRLALENIGVQWTEEAYTRCVTVNRQFSKALDLQVIQAFSLRCQQENTHLLTYPLADFVLSVDDRARYFRLSAFSDAEICGRLSLIQVFNRALQRVVHLVELLNTMKDSERKPLGAVITVLSGYVFPTVKEDVLEICINQTVYGGKDSYPVIELDNRRVFTDMERSSELRDAEFDVNDRSAMASQCMFAQLFYQMKDVSVDVLRCKLDSRDRLIAVKYKGEQGLDWGGLYRDTIERCVEDIFSDRIDLFIPCPNANDDDGANEEKYIPNPRYRESTEALAMYTFVGNLIGISLRTKHLLPFEVGSQVWKTIVGDSVNEDDVEAVDTSFVSTLRQIKDYQADGADDFSYLFGLVFAITDSAGNEVELLPSGSQIAVTFDTRMRFYDLALESRLNEGRQAAEAIAAGVYALIPQRALSLFTWEQLERAVKGVPEISMEILRKHTVYIGWTENHEVVQRFWRVMGDLSNKDRSQFLRFTWGRSKLPKTATWSRPFKLTYKNAGDNMLPVAHTCFFQLELPQYSNDEIMRERLLVAFHFGAGEFMLR